MAEFMKFYNTFEEKIKEGYFDLISILKSN
jgi:hypothetical protein